MSANPATTQTRAALAQNILSTSAGRIFLVFIVVVLALGFSSPAFFTLDNIVNVTRQMVFISIIAFAASFVIGIGGIDLSVGANVALTGLVMADLMLNGVNIYLAIVIGLLLGAVYGLVNGLLVNKLGIAPFIATLATMIIGRGIIQVYSGGVPKTGLRFPEFEFWGQSLILGVPFPVIVMVLAFAVCFYLMYRTKFGRFTLSIGSNREAARLVGIPVPRVEVTVYVLTGLAAAVSSLLLTSRLEAAMPEAATNYELDVIAAVVIGGTSLAGGRVSLLGTLIGAALMAVVRNGINLLNVNTFWQQVVIGGIILIAIAYDGIAGRRAQRPARNVSTPVHKELAVR